ncbi:unnamed protein product [Pylaiella littoralis]
MEGDHERKLPALKVFISQLNRSRQAVQTAHVMWLILLGVEFTRVWVQGVVVRVCPLERSFVVDDGTGTVTAIISGMGLDGSPDDAGGDDSSIPDGFPEKGQHVLLVGAVEAPGDELQRRRQRQRQTSSCARYRILCDVFKNLGSESPNRDTLWGLEVVDFWRSRGRNSQSSRGHARQV